MAQVQISQLPTASTLTGAEIVPVVQNGVTSQTTVSQITSSPTLTQSFLTVGSQPTLGNSRYLGVGSGVTYTDNGAGSSYVLSLTGAPLALYNNSTGIQVKTGNSTMSAVSLQVSGPGLSIANNDGTTGNPTISLTNYTGTGSTVALSVSPAFTGTPTAPTASLNTNTTQLATTAFVLQQVSASGGGTVTSVGMTVPSFLSVSPSTITSSGTFAVTLSGTALPTSNGGTGLSSYTAGDITYYSSGTSLSKLGIGTSGYFLTSSGSAPQWTQTLGIANGGTGQTTANSAFNALAPSQTSNSGKYLTTDGSNTSWATVSGGVTTISFGTTGLTPSTATSGAVTVAGTLAVGNGGTGLTSLTAGYIPYGNGTSAFASSSGFTFTSSVLTTPVLAVNSTTSTTPNLTFNASNSGFTSGATIANNYLQTVIQNKSGTSGASTNYVLSNDLGTDSGYYGEFGMNSSGYTASGTFADFFSINNGIYFSGHDGDISVGSGNGYKTYLTWGTTGQSAHSINASGAIGLSTNLGTSSATTGTTGYGTAGQVMISQGSSASPTWGAVAGGGFQDKIEKRNLTWHRQDIHQY